MLSYFFKKRLTAFILFDGVAFLIFWNIQQLNKYEKDGKLFCIKRYTTKIETVKEMLLVSKKDNHVFSFKKGGKITKIYISIQRQRWYIHSTHIFMVVSAGWVIKRKNNNENKPYKLSRRDEDEMRMFSV